MKNHNKRLIRTARKIYRFIQGVLQKKRLSQKIVIQPYRGFTNGKRLFLKGRVLEDNYIQVKANDSKWTNLLNSFKRFESDELPHAQVAIHINGQTFPLTSDEEGYFSLYSDLQSPLPPNDHLWENAYIELLHLPGHKVKEYTTSSASLLFPSDKAKFGVISDIDDTVLHTNVTSKLGIRMLYTTLFGNAHQRMPMEGIVSLFQAMEKGHEKNACNPFFYVSNSPWNIYDMLALFMEVQQLPKGPILLRDYGLSPANFSAEFKEHKADSMSNILDTFPNLPFILMGDTGAKDVDHYLHLARKYPRQIKTIYIRQLKDTFNSRRVAKLVANATDVDIRLIRHTKEIWQDAKEKGYIPAGE